MRKISDITKKIVAPYQNYLKHQLGSRDIMGLRFTVTWCCNSRCTTCAIWKQNPAPNELTLDEIDQFSRSKHFRHTEYITLSGGEPTMRGDLPEIVSILHRNIPSASFGITINGLRPSYTEGIFRKILHDNPNIRFDLVGISLNGPPKIHDYTRGILSSFNSAVETYDRLSPLVHCEFSFTFCDVNRNCFRWVQEFARNKGTRAYICWTVANERFRTQDKDLNFWRLGIERELENFLVCDFGLPKTFFSKLWRLIHPNNGILLAYLYDHALHKQLMPCYAGSQIVHIDPYGNIYPCNFKLTPDRLLGSLREKSFDEIWDSVTPDILQEIWCGKCQYPQGLCGDSDIAPSIKNNPPALFGWQVKKLLLRKPWIGCM